jgi:hypothetical protein
LKTIFLWFIAVISLLLLISHRPLHVDSSVPDTDESHAIMAAIQHAYDALSTAYATGDMNVLADAFVDHPDFRREIGWAREAELRSYINKITGPKAAQDFGYLTAIKNKLTHRLEGEKLLRSAMAKAKTENRELSEAEWQTLIKQNHGERPSLPDPGLPSKRVIQPEQYFSIEINGDKARATYDEGVTGKTAILILIDGRWYVAVIF